MPFLQLQEQQDLYYTWARAGDSPACTLLFIHGLGSSHSFYAPIIPSLVASGYACVAFDTPGSALSASWGHHGDMETLVQAAGALVAALGLDARRLVVIGHSMGAIMASELARRLDVLGVVLMGPVNPSDALSQVFAARIRLVQTEGMEAVASAVPATATGPEATPTHRAFIRTLLLAQTAQGYVSLCRAIMTAKRPRYGELHCPLLVIAGSHDTTSSLAGSQGIVQSWGVDGRHKHLQVLQGVGHWHCIEAGDEVCATLRQFADGLMMSDEKQSQSRDAAPQ